MSIGLSIIEFLYFYQESMYKQYTECHTLLLQPDPLMEALESVVGDRNSLDGRLQVAQAEAEVIMFNL